MLIQKRQLSALLHFIQKKIAYLLMVYIIYLYFFYSQAVLMVTFTSMLKAVVTFFPPLRTVQVYSIKDIRLLFMKQKMINDTDQCTFPDISRLSKLTHKVITNFFCKVCFRYVGHSVQNKSAKAH